MRKRSGLKFFAFLAGLLISGCTTTQYGKLQMPDRPDRVTVETLKKNWEDYEINYAGVHAGHPSAVLFERKDDDRGFATGRWFGVRDKELLDDLIDSIQKQLPVAGYYPRLWDVLGPDGHLYGYLFTSWDHAVLRAVDKKTLFVDDLPMPPYLAVDGDGKGTRMLGN
jgi:hypothetical protein